MAQREKKNNKHNTTTMRKIAQMVGLAVMAATMMMGTSAEAQTSSTSKGVQHIATAGTLRMAIPVQRQTDVSTTQNRVPHSSIVPPRPVTPSLITPPRHDVPDWKSKYIAQKKLSEQIQKTLMMQVLTELDNDSLSAVETALITTALDRSLPVVAAKLAGMMTQEHCLNTSLIIYCARKRILDSTMTTLNLAQQNVIQLLQEESGELKPEHEKLLNRVFAIVRKRVLLYIISLTND